MLNNRMPYKFFVMFLVFAAVLVVPVFLIVGYNLDRMFSGIEEVSLLFPEQRSVYIEYSEKLFDDLVTLSFYVFFIAFVMSLFFSRMLLTPIRDLYVGAGRIRAGKHELVSDGPATRRFGP